MIKVNEKQAGAAYLKCLEYARQDKGPELRAWAARLIECLGCQDILNEGTGSARVIKHEELTLSLGNLKLSRQIGIFNLPTVLTCPNSKDCRATCYARKAERRFPAVLASRKANYEASKREDFVELMCELIDRAKVATVRIHESGDFYSPDYFYKWLKVVQKMAGKRCYFYGYTKVLGNIGHCKMPENLNFVSSLLPDGSLNYGSMEYIQDKARRYHAFICPSGFVDLEKGSKLCGTICTACQHEKYVVFLKH